ncbi:hypothetical protein [Mycolicibacterium canariasense]|uniref:hypothetical protein n=1 Tax=Mycolicibacterium canariasense TaxID=228230 RepID=UPI0010425C99|nr:hypothetical protein [Mycolicibacterium canariasense]MCV7207522.1 hypothetical protein [Mycolicibacterium canariasense]
MSDIDLDDGVSIIPNRRRFATAARSIVFRLYSWAGLDVPHQSVGRPTCHGYSILGVKGSRRSDSTGLSAVAFL